MTKIATNIKRLRERIDAAMHASQRTGEELTLIAVTKTHPVELIDEAIASGIKHIAENKLQDAMRKLPFIKHEYHGFHFIGHLQTNKINQVLSLKPILIQSIDSLYLAEKLNATLKRTNKSQDILIQVNTSNEDSKSGVHPDEVLPLIKDMQSLSAISIKGLMTIGRYHPDPEQSRKYFRLLAQLFQEVKASAFEGVEMKYLSMGMTDDFEVAISEGSNMIRIGSAIFGQRAYGGDS